MKKVSITLIIISIIIAIVFMFFYIPSCEPVQLAYEGRPTKQDYQYLKELANQVAHSTNTSVITDDSITANTSITENSYIVNIKNNVCSVIAVYPASVKSTAISDNGFDIILHIDYDNVAITESAKVEPLWFYIILSIILTFLVAFVIYLILGLLYSVISVFWLRH